MSEEIKKEVKGFLFILVINIISSTSYLLGKLKHKYLEKGYSEDIIDQSIREAISELMEEATKGREILEGDVDG